VTSDLTASHVEPERRALRYVVASPGYRLIGGLIDCLILSFVEIVLWSVASVINGAFLVPLGRSPTAGPLGPTALIALGVALLLIFFDWWGYFVLFELLWNGQTIGKRRLGLRVIRADGQPIDWRASLVRNLFRIVDVYGMLGVIALFMSRRTRRLGDVAARTVVVREVWRPIESEADQVPAELPMTLPAPGERGLVPHAERLTAVHYQALQDHFARRSQLPKRNARRQALRLARTIADVIGIAPADVKDTDGFLAQAARAYERRGN